jgi:hypothetical protein
VAIALPDGGRSAAGLAMLPDSWGWLSIGVQIWL